MLASKVFKFFKFCFRALIKKNYFGYLVQLLTIFYKSRSFMIYVDWYRIIYTIFSSGFPQENWAIQITATVRSWTPGPSNAHQSSPPGHVLTVFQNVFGHNYWQSSLNVGTHIHFCWNISWTSSMVLAPKIIHQHLLSFWGGFPQRNSRP